ncbi:MAG: hypothetical protein Sv326_1319 (plasmid) [Candidatus Fermentimicrarchaeum limneticum]|uniref:Uncharacterized protein n=1 Tax=Fermentimicrarchaeum limneticum TaxID=2795018 RepID=A0A7D5XIT6_FERL1|nr:MAG: hypothetical protein Sv326_1319 [Candidatus Fermentimicrarchaeum limneticum]
MEVLVISFFFIFVFAFIALAMYFRSRTLYFASGTMLLLWGYMLLTYGVTETTISGRTAEQNFTYDYNATSNTTSISGIATNETFTNVTDKNDYTNSFGTAAVILGLVIAIVPIVQEATGGKITLI